MMNRIAAVPLLASTCALAQPAAVSTLDAEAPITSANALRSTAIELDYAALWSADEQGDRLTLGLFEDEHTAVIDRVAHRANGDMSWFGRVDNGGMLVLSAVNGVIAGRIETADAVFEVRPTDTGEHALFEIDEQSFPGCATGEEHHVKPEIGGGVVETRDPCSQDGSSIDVLVVYTPLARDNAGGTAAIESLAQSSIDVSNTAYANSQAGPLTLTLVHTQEVSYNETSSFGGHLNLLSGTSDGVMDEVHTLRELYQADLVALLVRDGASCGVAYLMTQESASFQDRGFSVTNVGCAVGNLTFPHELGHNMGCAHDRDNAGSALFNYSYGHRFNGTNGVLYRTVMAYSPGSRRAYFSNPDVNFVGTPTGVPLDDPGRAHNALTITNSRDTIANFRNDCSDCNNNTIGDTIDIANGTSEDCNNNLIPDECELALGTSTDCNSNGVLDDCEGPDCNGNGLPDGCDIASGFSLDCNSNGIADECEGPDCNGNFVPDACEIASGATPDCNDNGIPDECDLVDQAFAASSGALSPMGFGAAQQHTFAGAPEAVTDVTLDFLARGDLESETERVTVFLGSTVVGFVFETTGTLCTGDPAADQLVVPMAAWNDARDGNGDVNVQMSPSSAVDAAACAQGSYIDVAAGYTGRSVSLDANEDGVPDECVTLNDCGPGDVTTTGAGVGQPGYGEPDGEVTGADINFYVNAWVGGDGAIADITTTGAGVGDPGYGQPDGQITGADINYFVNIWVMGCP